MRYRIEIDSSRYGVHNEYFVEFRRNDVGRETIHTEPDRATWLSSIDVARIALRRLREYGIRCRLLDEYGNEHSGYDDAQQHSPVDIFTSHENIVWRDTLPDGRTIELPIIVNRAYNPPRYYFKFSTGPTGNEEPDRSISGSTAAECFERFVGNPHFSRFVDRFKVEPLPVAPPPAQPAAPMIQIEMPAGHQLVGISYRPGNSR